MQRQSVHNTPVNFRVNAAIIAAAEQKAKREGMSISELLRHALRNELKAAA